MKYVRKVHLFTNYYSYNKFHRYDHNIIYYLAGGSGRTGLVNRLQFHVSHKFGDEKRLMTHHQQLHDVLEDQLTLASMHYLRGHYQEAIDIYKRLLLENRELHALNVYVAMCYYKLDYFDVAQEVLQVYLQAHGESVTALNLRAATHYKLYNARAAESELRALQEMISPSFVFAQDLIRHNLVVFRNGDGALQTLVPLVDVIPEARLNLVIHYLRQGALLTILDVFNFTIRGMNVSSYLRKAVRKLESLT